MEGTLVKQSLLIHWLIVITLYNIFKRLKYYQENCINTLSRKNHFSKTYIYFNLHLNKKKVYLIVFQLIYYTKMTTPFKKNGKAIHFYFWVSCFVCMACCFIVYLSITKFNVILLYPHIWLLAFTLGGIEIHGVLRINSAELYITQR